jgi:hypothetical protein
MQKTVTVRVNVSRQGNTLRIDIDPSTVEVRRNETVEWEHDADELVIEAKGEWPFDDGPPRAPKGQPARSGSVRGNAPHRRYRYGIRLTLGAETIIIDPDIIIRG